MNVAFRMHLVQMVLFFEKCQGLVISFCTEMIFQVWIVIRDCFFQKQPENKKPTVKACKRRHAFLGITVVLTFLSLRL